MDSILHRKSSVLVALLFAFIMAISMCFGSVQAHADEPATTTVSISPSDDGLTAYAPTHASYLHSYGVMLYRQQYIQTKGDITSVSFHVDIPTSKPLNTQSMKIYLGHTSDWSLTDDVAQASYNLPSDMTLVYEGNPIIGAEAGWQTFEFNRNGGSFRYNNTDNLVVAVIRDVDEVEYQHPYYTYTTRYSSKTLHKGTVNHNEYSITDTTGFSTLPNNQLPWVRFEIVPSGDLPDNVLISRGSGVEATQPASGGTYVWEATHPDATAQLYRAVSAEDFVLETKKSSEPDTAWAESTTGSFVIAEDSENAAKVVITATIPDNSTKEDICWRVVYRHSDVSAQANPTSELQITQSFDENYKPPLDYLSPASENEPASGGTFVWHAMVNDSTISLIDNVNADDFELLTKNASGEWVADTTGIELTIAPLDGYGDNAVSVTANIPDNTDAVEKYWNIVYKPGNFESWFHITQAAAEQQEVDKAALIANIQAAQDAQTGVNVSEDGTDVDPSEMYVTPEEKQALESAISTAQAVVDNPDATQDQVDSAASAVQAAQEAFEAAKKPGTKEDVPPVVVETEEVTIEAAEREGHPHTPLWSGYLYSLTQQIYDTGLINKNGKICTVAFDVVNPSTTHDLANLKIYMCTTRQSEFTGNRPQDVFTSSELELVYDGVPEGFGRSEGWNTITLDTPFEYNMEAGNLVIAVAGISNTSDSGLTFARMNFFTTHPNLLGNRGSDDDPRIADIDMLYTPGVAGANSDLEYVSRSFIPCVQLGFEVTDEPPIVWDTSCFTYNEEGTTVTGLTEAGQALLKKNPASMIIPDNGPTGEPVTAIGPGSNGLGTFGFVEEGEGDAYDRTYVPTRVVLPSQLEEIGASAFSAAIDTTSNPRRAKGLTRVIFPNTLTKIGQTAFQNAPLEVISLPDSIQELGQGAFTANESLPHPKLSKLQLSRNLATIPQNAFAARKVDAITVPSGVQVVGRGAFAGSACTSLTLPTTLTQIDRDGFKNHALTKLEVPESVKTIGQSAFYSTPEYAGAPTLESIIFYEGLETIESNAFRGQKLNEVLIPSTLTSLHKDAFKDNINASRTDNKAVLQSDVDDQINGTGAYAGVVADGTGHIIEPAPQHPIITKITYNKTVFRNDIDEVTISLEGTKLDTLAPRDIAVRYKDDSGSWFPSVSTHEIIGFEPGKGGRTLTMKMTFAIDNPQYQVLFTPSYVASTVTNNPQTLTYKPRLDYLMSYYLPDINAADKDKVYPSDEGEYVWVAANEEYDEDEEIYIYDDRLYLNLYPEDFKVQMRKLGTAEWVDVPGVDIAITKAASGGTTWGAAFHVAIPDNTEAYSKQWRLVYTLDNKLGGTFTQLGDASGVVKTALAEAISEAREAPEGVEVSDENGKDLIDGTVYTTSAEKKALDDAIAAAQEVYVDPVATQDQVDAATKAVKDATQAYKDAKKTARVDKTQLLDNIKDALETQVGVKVSSDGKDVDPKDKWTTAPEKKALEDAIADAQAIADNPNVLQDEVDDAAAALKIAQDVYDILKKPGKKAAPQPVTTKTAIKSATAPAQKYTGKALKPAVTVKDAKGKVVPASAYTVTYANNKYPGTATATVKAKANSKYTGTVKATFKITAAEQGVYWLVNKKTGENLYTTAVKEVNTLSKVKKTWTNKGIMWYAPTVGDPIYRLVNKKTGDHHFTKSTNEVRVLTKVKKTWTADFNGKPIFYSGGPKKVWRQYSDARQKAGKPGTHKFTTYNAKLKGWKNEGALIEALRYGKVNGVK